MSSNNHIDLVELPASSPEQVQQAAAFYHDAFGWSFKDWGDRYHDTQDAGVSFGINASDPAMRQTTPMAVIYAGDLEAARQRVETAGGAIRHDIYQFPGGRRFHFIDPAGNELAVWGA